MPASFRWAAGAPVITPKSDEAHDLVAVKDPTIVRFNDRWHVYASLVTSTGVYGMVYTSFADFDEAPTAPFYYMDQTPGFNTYVAAPQLFYFAGGPRGRAAFRRVQRLQARRHESLSGADRSLRQHFELAPLLRSWTSESLEGPWQPLQDSGSTPFAASANVTFEGGAWSSDISHGELLRAGHDQRLTIDACALRFIFQGFDPSADTSEYNKIPWKLGLLELAP